MSRILKEAAELHIEEIDIENLKLKKIKHKTIISIDHLNKLLKKQFHPHFR